MPSNSVSAFGKGSAAARKSLQISSFDRSGSELWFATDVAVLGFNECARRVRADGEIFAVSAPHQEK